MPYNTRNPVGPSGSSDPRDLFDNSGIVDVWATDREKMVHPDRMGVPRKTLAGMEADFSASQADKEERFQQFLLSSGYQDLGDYTAGLEITGRNQVFRKDGELYRAAASTDLPYTTTGDWLTESSKFVSVGDAALRQELAQNGGSDLVGFVQAGAGAEHRTLQGKGREFFSVEDFGDTEGDSSGIINAAALALANAGGGRLEFTKRKYLVGQPITIYSNVHYVGKGRGATTIQAIAGSNADIFKTKDFDTLTGGGNLTSAPYAFSIKDMTLDGNYLDLTGGLTWRTSDTVLNSAGSAIKIYGSRYDLDVEVYNVADNALYSEGGGSFIENQEHASRVHLTGRISGQEGIVFRGPGDINMQYVIFGLCGHLPYSQRATASASPSKLYPGMNCVGLMLDNVSPFTGHVELGMVHIYAVSYNYGVYTRGVNRFNARHVVSENSLGGFYFGDGAHGVGSIIEARANGRYPDSYIGSAISGLRDVYVDNGTIWNLNLTIKSYRYLPSRDYSGFLVDVAGSNNSIRCAIFSQLQGAPTNKPLLAGALRVGGSNNTITLTAQRINGVLCHVSGNFNNIRGSAVSIYSGTALIREIGFGNTIDLTAGQLSADCVGFSSVGTVATEQIKLNISGSSGYIPFSGDPMAALNRACVWQIAASNGNTLNGKTTEDYIEINIPTDNVSGIINVDHNFLYAPNRTQVSLSLNFPGTPPNQVVHVGVLGSPTATQVALSYRWAALPTSGGANVQIHIR
ncbi:hypothetical protein [Pseudomonas sp. NBRC 111118]|uniref:hypothetical protein n=1 Tax=Pseudomonas sp. NBRC 111118 TaxID=1661033 RepID=UPI0006D48048|nr:hypothetical protein [Pseudomonas sp. NBRC 111118]